MREIRRSIEIARSPNQVWAWLADPPNWNILADSFGWGKFGRRFTLTARGAPQAAANSLVIGDQGVLKDGKGTAIMAWRLDEWAPPNRMALTATENGLLGMLSVFWAVDVAPIPEGSRVQATFHLKTNAAVEV